MQEADLISNNEATAFKIRQHYDKCRKRVEALPTSPKKQKEFRAKFAQKEELKFSKPMKCVPRKQLADDVKTSILKFYEDDNISYQAAGRGDFKKISVNGEIKEVQIRYLVMTLKEAHALFVLNQCGIPHNVCTCITHENLKFLLKDLRKKQVAVETAFREFVSQVLCCWVLRHFLTS